jgi:hypothetical protein
MNPYCGENQCSSHPSHHTAHIHAGAAQQCFAPALPLASCATRAGASSEPTALKTSKRAAAARGSANADGAKAASRSRRDARRTDVSKATVRDAASVSTCLRLGRCLCGSAFNRLCVRLGTEGRTVELLLCLACCERVPVFIGYVSKP